MKKILPIALLLLLLSAGCVQKQEEGAPAAEKVRLTLIATGYSGNVFEKTIDVEKGANAFEAMKENVDVNYTQYAFGPMINTIQGVKPEGTDYWALYVDGNYADKGISDYALGKDMTMEWKIEKSPY